MKRIVLFRLEKLKIKLKFNRTIFISGYDNCCEILRNSDVFQAPHQEKRREINRAYGLFNSAVVSEDKESPIIKLATFSKDNRDLSEEIPRLAREAVIDFLLTHGESFKGHHFSDVIYIKTVANYLELETTSEFLAAARTLFSWLFTNKQKQFIHLPEHDKRSISQSVETLKKSMSDLTLSLFIDFYPLLATELKHLLSSLNTHKKILLKIYQVASIRNMTAMENLVGTLQEKRKLHASNVLTRIVSEDTVLNRSWFPNLTAKTEDRIILLANSVVLAEKNPSHAKLSFQQGLTDELNKKFIGSVFTELFAKHRIKNASHKNLVLEELPKDPTAYRFSILGSSPPWAVAEEQTWLLDSYGIRHHLQHNVLSIAETLRLLVLQKTRFYDANLFYAAYDKQHHILIGSPFAGDGKQTIKMGEQFKTFASHLPIIGPENASDYSSLDTYNRCFDAYSTIRINYYTWAYFSAFLDKAYPLY